MSPEQASGKTLDARSDIFSFGAVLYEMLTGRRPFLGETSVDVLHNIVHSHPEPLSPDLPLPLRSLLEKALEKDPADRYQTMRDLVVDLRRLSRQTDTAARVTAKKPVAWKRIVAVAMLIIVPVLVVALTKWDEAIARDHLHFRASAVAALRRSTIRRVACGGPERAKLKNRDFRAAKRQ